MASDGRPPRRLPPGAKWVVLNQGDFPFTVPAGKRLVLVSGVLSFVESVQALGGVRELFVQAHVENDGNPNPDPAQGRVPLGLAISQNAAALTTGLTMAASNLCYPVAGGTVLTGAAFPAGANQVIALHGYLETVPA